MKKRAAAKKLASLLLVLVLIPFAGCAGGGTGTGGSDANEITVVSTFDSSDGNHENYVTAYTAFEEASGVTINDQSAPANEEWKKDVLASFEEGTEPDVLFYFTGADANKLVEEKKVVSIGDIRKEYPEYAANMKDSLIPVSPVDGRQYAVPVNGYWEALYVNTAVLSAAGVEVPQADYSWEQFLLDCQTIKDAGYTPIACSLGEVPHYWFEYCVFNNGSITDHTTLPQSVDDPAGQTWAAGLEDIKDLYNRGYFPADTTTMSDEEAGSLIIENQAAFLLDGSWKLGWVQSNAQNLADFTVTYAPAKGERSATEIVGGLSMGYFITQQAWDDPKKREACVEFVMAMTTDEVVTSFGELSITALKEGTTPPTDADNLVLAALDMIKGCTGYAAAAQDGITPPDARDDLFADVRYVVTDEMTPQQAIEGCIVIMKE